MENLKGKKLNVEILSEIPYDVNLRPKRQITLPLKLIKEHGLEGVEDFALIPVKIGKGGGGYEGVVGFFYYPTKLRPPKNDS